MTAAGEYPRSEKLSKPRKVGETTCFRCGGTGIWTRYHGVCYRCGGRGIDPTLRAWAFPASWSDEQCREWDEARLARNERARERKAEKTREREAEAAAANRERFPFLVGLDARWPNWADLPDYLGSFARDVYSKSFRFELTEAQAAALLPAIVEDAHFDALREKERLEAAPCPSGRVEIEGEVLKVKSYDTAFGFSLRMLVKADAGFRVFGTVPRAIETEVTARCRTEARRSGGTAENADDLMRGSRVRFSAEVTPSADDPAFGFFKRPTKAEILSNGNGKEAK